MVLLVTTLFVAALAGCSAQTGGPLTLGEGEVCTDRNFATSFVATLTTELDSGSVEVTDVRLVHAENVTLGGAFAVPIVEGPIGYQPTPTNSEAWNQRSDLIGRSLPASAISTGSSTWSIDPAIEVTLTDIANDGHTSGVEVHYHDDDDRTWVVSSDLTIGFGQGGDCSFLDD